MKKEKITNISLNSSGNLVIEYGSRSSTLKDNELTSEQKEIKEFFQATGENKLSRNILEQAIKQNQQGKKPKDNRLLIPAIGIGIIILLVVGMIIYCRNKRGRSY